MNIEYLKGRSDGVEVALNYLKPTLEAYEEGTDILVHLQTMLSVLMHELTVAEGKIDDHHNTESI